MRARIGCEASRAARISSISAGDRGRLAGAAAEPREDENPVRIDLRMAVGQPHRASTGIVCLMPPPVDRVGRDQHILEFAAIGAGIGPEPAADRAGNAGQEFEARRPRPRRRSARRSGRAPRRRPRPSSGVGLDLGKAAPEPDRRRPRMPPSRTSRFEPTPITVTGISRGSAARNAARSSASAGRNSTSAGPPTRNQVNGPIGASARQPPAHRRQSLDQRSSTGRRSQLRQLVGQRVRPVRDRAGAEAHDHVARPRHRRAAAAPAPAARPAAARCGARARAARRPARPATRPRSAPRRPGRHRRPARYRRR